MKKRYISIIILILIAIIMFIVYVAFEEVEPQITEIFQDKITSIGEGFSKINNGNSSSNEKETESVMSYEQKQACMKILPNVVYKGKTYHTFYGKKVFENDVYLDLSDVEIDENLVSNLELVPNLKEVNLYNQNLSKSEKIALQEKFPEIHFKWQVELLGENVDSSIETLDLNHKKITNVEDFKNSLKLLPNLKKLDMSYTNLSNDQLGELRLLFPNIRIDWVVHMSKWSVRTDAVAFSVLVYTYDYRRMTTQDIQVLKYCTELQALDLGHQAIEDITVIGEYLPNLRVLILADNKIKDISPIANLKHLHYLELFMNDITDSSPLSSCKELVDLNISFNYRFSDISGILNLPLLERLWLISDRISAESYDLIRKTYPNVKLITTGSGSTNSGWRTHERYYKMIDMFKNNYINDVFLQYDNK